MVTNVELWLWQYCSSVIILGKKINQQPDVGPPVLGAEYSLTSSNHGMVVYDRSLWEYNMLNSFHL